MKKSFLMAAAITFGLSLGSSAFAQNTSQSSEVELIPGTWVCLNNGNPACKNPPNGTQFTQGKPLAGSWTCANNGDPVCGNPPNAYINSDGKLEKGNWNCINNGNGACGNPSRFNVVPAKN